MAANYCIKGDQLEYSKQSSTCSLCMVANHCTKRDRLGLFEAIHHLKCLCRVANHCTKSNCLGLFESILCITLDYRAWNIVPRPIANMANSANFSHIHDCATRLSHNHGWMWSNNHTRAFNRNLQRIIYPQFEFWRPFCCDCWNWPHKCALEIQLRLQQAVCEYYQSSSRRESGNLDEATWPSACDLWAHDSINQHLYRIVDPGSRPDIGRYCLGLWIINRQASWRVIFLKWVITPLA